MLISVEHKTSLITSDLIDFAMASHQLCYGKHTHDELETIKA